MATKNKVNFRMEHAKVVGDYIGTLDFLTHPDFQLSPKIKERLVEKLRILRTKEV